MLSFYSNFGAKLTALRLLLAKDWIYVCVALIAISNTTFPISDQLVLYFKAKKILTKQVCCWLPLVQSIKFLKRGEKEIRRGWEGRKGMLCVGSLTAWPETGKSHQSARHILCLHLPAHYLTNQLPRIANSSSYCYCCVTKNLDGHISGTKRANGDPRVSKQQDF